MKRPENEEKIKTDALKTSVKEGATTTFYSSITDNYIIPFILALKGTSLQIGIISSLAGLINPISQFVGSRMMEKYDRKKIVLTSLVLQLIMMIPLIIISVLAFKGVAGKTLVI